MENAELLLLVLMAAVGGLSILAGAVRVPYPILLVPGGLVLGFIPGVPVARLPPDLVLVLFLPPLLYRSAFFSSPRELRSDARVISLLAVGLVLVTSSTVAMVAHALVGGLPWAAAFTLGAIVSPTDPLAATAIARRLGVPRRVVTVLKATGRRLRSARGPRILPGEREGEAMGIVSRGFRSRRGRRAAELGLGRLPPCRPVRHDRHPLR